MPRPEEGLLPERPQVLALQGEALAVHLFDLDRLNEQVVLTLIRPHVSMRKEDAVRTGDGPQDAAVPFVCELLTAAVILDAVRSGARSVGDAPPRTYLRRQESWVPLPAKAVLTQVVDGKARLNPSIFRFQVTSIAPTPAPVIF